MEGKHSHTHTIIRETTERTESTMKHLEEKMIVIERVQNESQDGLKKEFDDLKDQTKKAENDLEERIKQVRNYLHVNFFFVKLYVSIILVGKLLTALLTSFCPTPPLLTPPPPPPSPLTVR